MRSYNGHEYSMHSGTYSWKTTPKEQITIIAHSSVPLTLSGQVLTPDGGLRTQILYCGNSIDLTGLFTNFTSLKITSSHTTKKFGFYIKSSARQLQEPHNPADKPYIATLPEPEETQVQKLTRTVLGLQSKKLQHVPGYSMEPEEMPYSGLYSMEDDDLDIFEDDPIPQDAHIPEASDPAVQPQGNPQPEAEPQPSPPTNEPKTNDKGQ